MSDFDCYIRTTPDKSITRMFAEWNDEEGNSHQKITEHHINGDRVVKHYVNGYLLLTRRQGHNEDK